MSLLITGVRLADGSVTDLAVEQGRFVEPTDLSAPAERIDADGLLALPGLVDLHTHLREPGREDAETVASGTLAAARGGYTAVFAMPNLTPATDTGEAVVYLNELAARDAHCEVVPIGAVTKAREGEELAELGLMAAQGVTVFSDDGACVHDSLIMRRALTYLKPFGGVVAQHAQDPRLAGPSACCHESEISGRLGLPGWPTVAESTIVARDVQLAEFTGGRAYVARDVDQLVGIYAEIDRLEPVQRPGQRLRPRIERYAWPLSASLLLALLVLWQRRGATR